MHFFIHMFGCSPVCLLYFPKMDGKLHFHVPIGASFIKASKLAFYVILILTHTRSKILIDAVIKSE